MRSLMRVVFLALLASAAANHPALAHALGAECKLHGERVELEAYYDDDTPARDAKVRLLDADKKLLAEGRTDAQGRCALPAPQPGRYQVVVDAGAGHVTQLSITVPARDAMPAVAVSLGDGPKRRDFTRFPWIKVCLGLGIIGAAALTIWAVRLGLRALSRRTCAEAAPFNSPAEQGRSS